MYRGYKYRIYPTDSQIQMIEKTFGICRLVYNLALQTKIEAYKANGTSLSAFDLINQLIETKRDYEWMREVSSQALKASVMIVGAAFKSFFRGNGYPKFKSKHDQQSFQCPTGTRRIDFKNNLLTIPKIPNIPICISRPFVGEIKNITISKAPSGKYFASILAETIDCPIIRPVPKNAVGIDLGVTDFATLSTGEKIANPRHLRLKLARLKILQRRASRKKKGRNSRGKANLRVAILHEKISNQRHDFLHKLSTKLISDNQTDTICIENLTVKNMVKNHNLAQAISDVSWSEFVRQLEYKGKWYGKNVIKINRFYASSKTCSNCGHKKDILNLKERTWDCSNCGANHDRDINAAINIRNSGMGSPGEPVELASIEAAKKQESIPKRRLLQPPSRN